MDHKNQRKNDPSNFCCKLQVRSIIEKGKYLMMFNDKQK